MKSSRITIPQPLSEFSVFASDDVDKVELRSDVLDVSDDTELGADGSVVVAEERDPRSSRVPTVCVALSGAVLSTDPRERLAPSSWGISNIGFVSRISSVSTGFWLSFFC